MTELETAVALLDALPNKRRAKFVVAEIRCAKCNDRIVEVLDTTPRCVVSTPGVPGEDWDAPPRRARERTIVPLDELPATDGVPAMCRCRARDVDPEMIRRMVREQWTRTVTE